MDSRNFTIILESSQFKCYFRIQDLVWLQCFNTQYFTIFKVPGRMGLLIMASLITWNIYGSTNSPPSRGFSHIEVWITGVQCNILLAIFEYACILALKRTTDGKNEHMDKIIKNIDLVSLFASLIFISVFIIFYWFL